jgi:SAM-dependent methyltransferase
MSLNDEEYLLSNPFGLETESDFHAARRNTTVKLINQFGKGKDLFRILDVGCGVGSITTLISESIPQAKIDAIDIVEKAIIQAQINSSKINFFHADGMVFQGLGYNYDVILLNNIYEHIENPCGMLINLKNLLNDDGVFIISTPNRYFIKNILRKLLGLSIAIPKYHITEYSIGQIYDHHLYAGLKINLVTCPKFSHSNFKLINFISYTILQPIFDFYLKIMQSKTRLGSLLFIVSSK